MRTCGSGSSEACDVRSGRPQVRALLFRRRCYMVTANSFKTHSKSRKMSSESDRSPVNSSETDSPDYEQEVEGLAVAAGNLVVAGDEVDRPYAGEPRADEDWLRNYRRRRNEERERREILARRLNGTISLNDW